MLSSGLISGNITSEWVMGGVGKMILEKEPEAGHLQVKFFVYPEINLCLQGIFHFKLYFHTGYCI